MPSYIVKPRPDRDLYVMWSTVVDNLTGVGTRSEFEADYRHDPRMVAAERFDRADTNGTSATGESGSSASTTSSYRRSTSPTGRSTTHRPSTRRFTHCA